MQNTEVNLWKSWVGVGKCRSGKYRIRAQKIMGGAMNAREQDTFVQTFAKVSLQIASGQVPPMPHRALNLKREEIL